MDTKQLMTFLSLCRTLNYQKAAEQLQYAPSTLFKHIQLLEQEFGAPLFCKAGRQLQLTAEGRSFKGHAERMLEEYRQAMDCMAGDEGLDGAVSIGGCELNTANSLLNLLTRFSQSHPRARMNMISSPNAMVPTLVKNDMIDLGFFYSTSEKEYPGLQRCSLYQEPIHLVTSRENPLTRRHGLTYEELAGMSFVYPHDSCCFITEFLSRLRRKNVQLGKLAYLGGMHLVVEQVHKEQALSLIPQCAAERFEQTYDMVKLDMAEEPIWAWETVIFKSYDNLKPIAKSLIRHSISYAQGIMRSSPEGLLREPGAESLTM